MTNWRPPKARQTRRGPPRRGASFAQMGPSTRSKRFISQLKQYSARPAPKARLFTSRPARPFICFVRDANARTRSLSKSYRWWWWWWPPGAPSAPSSIGADRDDAPSLLWLSFEWGGKQQTAHEMTVRRCRRRQDQTNWGSHRQTIATEQLHCLLVVSSGREAAPVAMVAAAAAAADETEAD